MKCLQGCIFLLVLTMGSMVTYAAEDAEIIEFQGDRYVIHVDRMNPDSEMTLLDVLNTCPEYLSLNGKMIDLNYTLRVGNIDLVMDLETFLAHVKACEVERIHICSNTSVAKAVGGTKGVIDVYYRNDVKTDGKVAVTGSTYGSGTVYADITNRSEKLTVQGYAMARTSYGKAYPTDVYRMTERGVTENLHLNVDWQMSKNDRLVIKVFQLFSNTKQKLYNPDLTEAHSQYNRFLTTVFSYSHIFENKAIFFAEAGNIYTRYSHNPIKLSDEYPYAFCEINTPLFTPDLWLMLGTELDYENSWYIGQKRDQHMVADVYAQFDYTHGPWVLTIGDRFRMMSFWSRQYNVEDQSLWNHHRNNHSCLAV